MDINRTTAEKIVAIFEQFRMIPTILDQFDTIGKEVFIQKLLHFILNNQTIQFVMLGFPFKSTNSRDKVLGILPDYAEELSIQTFLKFTEMIKNIYSPGAIINIASDGYVFNELLGVSDSIVQQYKEICLSFANGNSCFQILDLNDFYSQLMLSDKRNRLFQQFGIDEQMLQAKILYDPDVNYLYKGMVIFMQEEIAPRQEWVSNNQHHKAAKKLAKEMMLMNEAYSNLVKHEFSNNIRLSMHPSVNNGAKYSFQMISPESKHSAWHSTVLISKTNNITTTHKRDALLLPDYELVEKNNQPYYFQQV